MHQKMLNLADEEVSVAKNLEHELDRKWRGIS